MLTDKHMHAAHKLLRKQFPAIQGCLSTLLEQNNGFKPVGTAAVQIHYTGSLHWVTSANIGGTVKLFDSKVTTLLTNSLERQLVSIYQGSKEQMLVSRNAAQQQERGVDCGLFSIAFAYHLLNGDAIEELSLKQSKMCQHMIKCFEQRELSPFPVTDKKVKRCRKMCFTIQLHCTARVFR